MNIKRVEGRFYSKFVKVYYDLGQYEKVIESVKKSFEIKKIIGDNQGEGILYNDLVLMYWVIYQF